MSVLIQVHRTHGVWKFYEDPGRAYLGQILASTKEDVPALASAIAKVLRDEEVTGYEKITQPDGSVEITLNGKRAGAFERDFSDIADAIDNK